MVRKRMGVDPPERHSLAHTHHVERDANVVRRFRYSGGSRRPRVRAGVPSAPIGRTETFSHTQADNVAARGKHAR